MHINPKKLVLVILTFLLSTTVGAFFAYHKPNEIDQLEFTSDSLSRNKTWVYWWPPKSSPWMLQKQHGGTTWSSYNSAADKPKLEQEMNELVTYHKPDYLVVFMEANVLMPHRALYKQGSFATGNAKLDEVRDLEMDFTFYDDIVEVARKKGIKTIFYPVFSPYGGRVIYPYTYASNVGWFWARPDWGPAGMSPEERVAAGYGYANPITDAMRHPPAALNGSDYNWLEHEAGYLSVNPNARHHALTTDNVENTGFENIGVYESPDLVYNGFDVYMPGSPTLHLHVPVPSYSSAGYRKLTKEMFAQIASHFKDNTAVYGYYTFQEPTYAHLRENIKYTSGFSGNTGAGDSSRYEVDYSPAELASYNTWRQSKSLPPVAQIPYPVDAEYEQFRQWNLADFNNMIASTIRQNDPDTKIMLSIMRYNDIDISEVNPGALSAAVKPEILTIEPPQIYPTLVPTWSNLVNELKAGNPNLKIHLSHHITDANHTDVLKQGFDEIILPAFNSGKTDPNSVGDYPHWLAEGNCANPVCTPLHPSTNTLACIPDCGGKTCGDDGCGGSCGTCGNGTSCSNSFQCTAGGASPTPPPGAYLCGDMDSDGDQKIKIADFAAFQSKYNKNCTYSASTSACGSRDSNQNSIVDIADFANFVKNYGKEKCQ